LMLNAVSVYFALAIARLTNGAPRAWYVIVIGFVVLFIFWGAQLFLDVQSPSDVIHVEEAAISLLAGILFLAGLSMLNSSFRRRLKAAQT